MDAHEHFEKQESCQVGRGSQNLTFVHFRGKKERKKIPNLKIVLKIL